MSLKDDVEALETALGDASDPATGVAVTLASDESELFPEAGANRLVELGFARELVPVSEGGAFHDAERVLALGRVIARRDLALAIATGQSLLGALPVWLAGSIEQRVLVRDALVAGQSGALALTERAHGSDLASSDVRLVRDEHGFAISGEKWAINNGTRGRYLSVLARSDESGGPRGFSIALVDTSTLGDTALPLAKIRTHGIRAADISGRAFAGTRLPASCIVGKEGHGLDLVQRTMQVSRTLCGAFSLGGAEPVLRMTLAFASARSLYGDTVLSIPAARAALREAFVSYFTADLVAHATARALSIAPEQASVSSAVAKVFVPEEAIGVVDRACGVLGARHYLREGAHALAQKMVRDVRLIPLFDGSAAVNRSALAAEWPRIASATLNESERDDAYERTLAMVDVGEALAPLAFDRLRATSRGLADPFQSLGLLASNAAELTYEYARLADRAHAVDASLRAVGSSAELRARSRQDARSHELADAFVLAYVLALVFARMSMTRDEDEHVLLAASADRLLGRLEGRGPLRVELGDGAHEDARLDALLVARCADRRALGLLGETLAEDAGAWHVC